MANPVIITPNMNLPNPVPGIDLGPDYANNQFNAINIIDVHNHTSGNGIQIPTAGININANFPINNFQITNAQAITFTAQTSLATLFSVYCVGNDLYYNDGASNVIQLTSGGAVNATSSGISSGSASAAFSSSVLVVNAAANTPANIQVASILLGNNLANSKFLTLSPPGAMASNYSLVLPSVPGSLSFVTLDTSGNLGTASSVSGSQIAAGSITGSQLANGTITTTQISSSAGILGSQLSASANITGTQLASNAAVTPGQNSTFSSSYYVEESVATTFTSTSTSFTLVTGLTCTLPNFNSDRPTFFVFTQYFQLESSSSGAFTMSVRVGSGAPFGVAYASQITVNLTSGTPVVFPLSIFNGASLIAKQTLALEVATNSTNLTITIPAGANMNTFQV